MKALERIVAEKLLKIKAVKLQPANPFTWASGWKSPIYCDNRKTLSYPAIRTFIKLKLTRMLKPNFSVMRSAASELDPRAKASHWSKPYHDYCEKHNLKWTRHYWEGIAGGI